eukprot:CAMPEP_0194448688 /NCGR_PEP_ID=MMETSP0176-20130528/129715_1 /TAXON_ID=216777 /ORGANISM="Proboscia alata, Strain PI-D3" /LENGTH=360 /DNA_ID=CAMNT_0039275701 /DNA_START=82 /DNA_END=1164 /DNA_ORIENTATION=+
MSTRRESSYLPFEIGERLNESNTYIPQGLRSANSSLSLTKINKPKVSRFQKGLNSFYSHLESMDLPNKKIMFRKDSGGRRDGNVIDAAGKRKYKVQAHTNVIMAILVVFLLVPVVACVYILVTRILIFETVRTEIKETSSRPRNDPLFEQSSEQQQQEYKIQSNELKMNSGYKVVDGKIIHENSGGVVGEIVPRSINGDSNQDSMIEQISNNAGFISSSVFPPLNNENAIEINSVNSAMEAKTQVFEGSVSSQKKLEIDNNVGNASRSLDKLVESTSSLSTPEVETKVSVQNVGNEIQSESSGKIITKKKLKSLRKKSSNTIDAEITPTSTQITVVDQNNVATKEVTTSASDSHVQSDDT